MKMKDVLLILLAWALFPFVFYAQPEKIDSLILAAEQSPNDTTKALLYIDVGELYGNLGDLENAKQYFIRARDISQEIDYVYGTLCYTVCMGDLLRFEGHYDSALFLNQKMLELALTQDDETIICKSYVNLGLNHENKGWWETALENYLAALSYAEKLDFQEGKGVIYDMLQLLYQHLSDYEKGVYYGEKSAEILQENPRLPQVLIRLAFNYLNIDDFQKAEDYLREADSILRQSPSLYYEAELYNTYAHLSIAKGDWRQAPYYADTALTLYNIMGYPARIAEMTLIQAQDNIYKNRLDDAKNKIDSVLEISEAFRVLSGMESGMDLYSKIALLKGDIDAHRLWEHRSDSVRNLIANEALWRTAEELNAKYETEKKDIQIAALGSEKRLFFILMLGSAALVFLILAIFLYRIRLNRKQKQLLTAQVALESETAERSRLAKDLHDGLGGMLSLVKINLSDMKGMKIIDQQDADRFGKALNMLDNSISELRRVAHHIMPESLIRNGLKTSLEDFAKAVPGAEFHFYGTEKRLDSNLEIVLYRSAHELVNNALKHASATRINIQLVQEPGRISLTVVDDGTGFDVKQESKGSGLQNIKNRILMYHGEMYIFSDNASGTEIHIEIPLK